jgi:hypothetical protein
MLFDFEQRSLGVTLVLYEWIRPSGSTHGHYEQKSTKLCPYFTDDEVCIELWARAWRTILLRRGYRHAGPGGAAGCDNPGYYPKGGWEPGVKQAG